MPRHLFLGSALAALAALAAFALAYATAAAAEECPAGSIARDAITSVRFRAGQYSAAVRTTPVPQMRCVAGPCPMYREAFEEASCTNTNTNAQGGPIWRCTAHSDAFALTTATVAFEGFRRRGDECVTIGSGALDYGVERITAPPVSASVVFARTVDREDQASDCEAKGGHTSVCYAASGEDR